MDIKVSGKCCQSTSTGTHEPARNWCCYNFGLQFDALRRKIAFKDGYFLELYRESWLLVVSKFMTIFEDFNI